jgi:putative transposase
MVLDAIEMAGWSRGNTLPGLTCHSDAGSQFTSVRYGERLAEIGAVPSIGSGQCYDNAMIESFWGRLQTVLLNRKRWKTRIELANAIFDYLEIFHNRQRRHSAVGMRTPIEFELLHQSAQPVA